MTVTMQRLTEVDISYDEGCPQTEAERRFDDGVGRMTRFHCM